MPCDKFSVVSGVVCIQYIIDGAVVLISSTKAGLWKMIFARGFTISVFGKLATLFQHTSDLTLFSFLIVAFASIID